MTSAETLPELHTDPKQLPPQVFETAADIFRAVSAPLRLRILCCLREGEKNVSELLSAIETTQPNMSQHLNTLYRNQIIGRRREGTQIYYRIINTHLVALCQNVCAQIAHEPHAAANDHE